MKSLFKFSLARSWNKEREISDRDQLLSMRFTTNAEAAKGKIAVTKHHIYVSYYYIFKTYIKRIYQYTFQILILISKRMGYLAETTNQLRS